MKAKSFRMGLAGILSLIGGCATFPEYYSIGVVGRQIKGRNKISTEEKIIPFTRIEASKKINDKSQLYLGGDFVNGEVDLSPSYLDDGRADGNMQSLRAGLNIFPFNSERFSIDVGAELFNADFEVKGEKGGINNKVEERVFGWGLNLGATFEMPINNFLNFGVFGGYNFTDNQSKNGYYDFDGWYGGMHLRLRV